MSAPRHEPKISLPEILFVGSLIGLADLVELVLLFFGLDDFWISDAIAFPATQIYLRMKGVKGTYSLMANTLELIPWLGDLPLRTIGFGITIWIDRHPEQKYAAVAKIVDVAHKGGLPYSKTSLLPSTDGGGPRLPAQGDAAVGEPRFDVAPAGISTMEAGAIPTPTVARGAAGAPTAGREAVERRRPPAGGLPQERGGPTEAPEGTAAPKEELTEEEYLGEKSPLERLKESFENLPETGKKQEQGVDVDDKTNQVRLPKAA